MSEAPEIWYRYVDYNVSTVIDAEQEIFGSETKIRCDEYIVLRHTPKGVWLYTGEVNARGGERFVQHNSRKKFAHPTKIEAINSFQERKKRQLSIYRARIKDAKKAFALAEIEARKMLNQPIPFTLELESHG